MIYFKYTSTPQKKKGIGRYMGQCVLQGTPFAPDLPFLIYASRNWHFHGVPVTSSLRALLIDAKSVELSWKGKVSHRPQDVFSAIKASAWKGIEQGLETAARLRTTVLPEPFSKAATPIEIFLLIVTYEPLHLGSGKDFASAIAVGAVKELEAHYGGQLPIASKTSFF